MIVTSATPDDCAELQAVQTASWRAAYAHALPPEAIGGALERDMAERWADLPAGVLAARIDGKITGFVRIIHKQGWPYIDNLHVLPGLRRTGTGRALMGAAARQLAAQGEGRLWLTVLGSNRSALAFYRAMEGVQGAAIFEMLLGQRVQTYPVIWGHLGELIAATN